MYLTKWLLKNNSNPSINCSIYELVTYYIEESNKLNIRGDIAFCQACLETAYFRYGGIVLPSQNNFCGLSALNNNSQGQAASFDTPRLGVRAQLQHLFGYASTDELTDIIDPRFKYIKRGSAQTWEDLGGHWAVPGWADTNKYTSFEDAYAAGVTYGQLIMDIYNKMKDYSDNN